MATEWFYETMGEIVGPLTASQLLDRIRAGHVKSDTPIRKDDSQWVPAEEISGLFEAVQRKAAEQKCPYCGASVPRPPTTCHRCDRKLVLAFDPVASVNGEPVPKAVEKKSAEEIEAEVRRRDIIRYSSLLVVWVIVLFGSPYLIFLAINGKLILDGELTVISVMVVTALLIVIYFVMSRLID